jgi:hypothetical protein
MPGGVMNIRRIIEIVLTQVIFALFQWAAHAAHGWLTLLGAWALILALTWVQEEKTLPLRIVQAVVQTGWLLFLLGVFGGRPAV